MKYLQFTAAKLFGLLLLCALSSTAASAQGTARIKLESLDKLSAKATQVVHREDRAKGGDGTVYVRCFEFGQAGDYKEADLREVRAQLRTTGWSRFMRVANKDDDPGENETTEIYIFGQAAGSDLYSGMTIITTEPKELTVVNIVGQGSVKEIGRQGKQAKSPK
jgi:hypothetical protein